MISTVLDVVSTLSLSTRKTKKSSDSPASTPSLLVLLQFYTFSDIDDDVDALQSLSRLVLDRFAAVRSNSSKCGILSILQSARDIKISIWNSFAVDF